MVSLNWGEIFARGISTGVKEFSNVAKAKDASVKAEAKASAEAFAEANDNYKTEVENNKKALAKEVDSISDLVGGDINKIRTVMKTYGNAEVVSQLQKDFEKYQADAFYKEARTGEQVKFKTLKDYINGKLTQTGTALVSDEAAEQAADEAAVVGDELDIQKAEQKAKGMGITLEQYLNTQARKLSSKPAFSVEGKAARLVEESKMGLFGKTLTMEEARQMVTSGQKLGGEEVEDLGDTGYALAREGGLGAAEKAKILSEVRQMRGETGETIPAADKIKLRNDIGKSLSANKLAVSTDSVGGYDVLDTKPALSAAIKEIEQRLKDPKLEIKDRSAYESLKDEFERKLSQLGKKKKTLQDAIEEVRKKPKLIKEFVKKFGKEKLPPELQKLIPKEDKEKKKVNQIKAVSYSVDPRPTNPTAAAEWDKQYGETHYPKNGRPKTQQQINYDQRVN
jgi:hypothetical protein